MWGAGVCGTGAWAKRVQRKARSTVGRGTLPGASCLLILAPAAGAVGGPWGFSKVLCQERGQGWCGSLSFTAEQSVFFPSVLPPALCWHWRGLPLLPHAGVFPQQVLQTRYFHRHSC